MAIGYAAAKAAAIDLVDDFTESDVAANYGSHAGAKYNAKTKLDKLLINAVVRATMPPRINKVMSQLCGPGNWMHVGSIDVVAAASIGDMIVLVCAHSATVLPDGEPR